MGLQQSFATFQKCLVSTIFISHYNSKCGCLSRSSIFHTAYFSSLSVEESCSSQQLGCPLQRFSLLDCCCRGEVKGDAWFCRTLQSWLGKRPAWSRHTAWMFPRTQERKSTAVLWFPVALFCFVCFCPMAQAKHK